MCRGRPHTFSHSFLTLFVYVWGNSHYNYLRFSNDFFTVFKVFFCIYCILPDFPKNLSSLIYHFEKFCIRSFNFASFFFFFFFFWKKKHTLSWLYLTLPMFSYLFLYIYICHIYYHIQFASSYVTHNFMSSFPICFIYTYIYLSMFITYFSGYVLIYLWQRFYIDLSNLF